MSRADEDVLDSVAGLARIVGRLVTAPEARRALAYTPKMRAALDDLLRAQSRAAQAATRVLALMGAEDSDEYTEREVEYVTLSVRRK